MDDNFNSGDRQTLIELRVDMRYTKEAIDKIGAEHAAVSAGFQRDVKEVWSAIEDLRAFRWWMAGGIAVASIVGGGAARMFMR
jgi:hypothetical protein